MSQIITEIINVGGDACDAKTLTVNGRTVAFTNERNLLEVIRKAGIAIPTFCYHSELSIYGACRLCLVDVEGKGVMASCSTAPAEGMVVRTETAEIRRSRKINVELLLAAHEGQCPTCDRSANCSLQNLARQLGVEEVRYQTPSKRFEIDRSSPSLVRDPNKCVLCGDCVRVCSEIQGIGAIDFANRGAAARVMPAFDEKLGAVECVNCGQCAAVCPTGAIVPKPDRDAVWEALYDPTKKVVVQIAPAVRVAVGDSFGFAPGDNCAGRLVAALKLLGFDQVYDTSFAADMTIFEEATELLGRVQNGGPFPMFTSCCPAWVKYAEIYFPELLKNISSCRSPQAMFGSVMKKILPEQLGCDRKDLVVVSIMPCTAKKFEASLPKFATDNVPDVDYVLTTIEVQRMISSLGIRLDELQPEAFDMPLGFASGAGVIFGASGGVMEAALRYAAEAIGQGSLVRPDFKAVRGMAKTKEADVKLGDTVLKVAVVYGLAEAKKLLQKIAKGEALYHFVEVMACPGGCVSGGGQPVGADDAIRLKRQNGLYDADRLNQVRKSQDNYMVKKCYNDTLGGGPGSHEAHEKLHTFYQNRSQLFDAKIPIIRGKNPNALPITVTICARQEHCPGELLLGMISAYVREKGYTDAVWLDAAFSSRANEDGTVCVTVGDRLIERTRFTNAVNTIEQLENQAAFEAIKKAIDSGVKG